MEEPPDWYLLVQEAKYLGVAPWELLQAPTIWRSVAQEANAAEHYAREQHRQHKKG